MKAVNLKSELKKLASPDKAAAQSRFFKTDPGSYAYGDIFIGVSVPDIRKVIKKYFLMSHEEILKVLKSKIHEERLAALLVLVQQFARSEQGQQEKIYHLYTDNLKYVNNWDLVDCSAYKIVGPYLETKSKFPLTNWAKSNSLWERRVAIMSTFHYIRLLQFSETFRIAKILLNDDQDLIQKAVGWMLREVGKKDILAQETFMKKHYRNMPRTMLRYAIEKFPEAKRKSYLNGTVKL